jgi:riboflavin biosynthesis pyrimidine reductase
VGSLKDSSVGDLGIGGPTIAVPALRSGLVDQLDQYVTPVVVGGGTPWLPPELRIDLELVEQRAFGSGVVHLRYRVRG